MSQPNILNKVKYRLQNVDYETFLERRGRRDLVLRPLKKKSKNQQVSDRQPIALQLSFHINARTVGFRATWH